MLIAILWRYMESFIKVCRQLSVVLVWCIALSTQVGATALIVASQNGHSAIVKQLLDYGSDVHAATEVSPLSIQSV